MSNVVVPVQIGRGEFLRKKAKTKDIYQNDTTVCYFVYEETNSNNNEKEINKQDFIFIY